MHKNLILNSVCFLSLSLLLSSANGDEQAAQAATNSHNLIAGQTEMINMEPAPTLHLGGDLVEPSAPDTLAPLAPSKRRPSEALKLEEDDSNVPRWLRRHLEIGARFAKVELDKPTRWDSIAGEGFVGTISELEEKQSSAPYSVVLGLRLNQYIGVNGSWDRLRADARTNTSDEHIDGAYTVDGPTLTIVGSLPLPYGLTPYIEGGWHFLTADFDLAPWWHLGYPSPAVYQELGSPQYSTGKRRYMDTRETVSKGTVFGGGILIALSDNLRLDFAMRRIEADAESHFYMKIGSRTEESGVHPIPLSYTAYYFGMRYAF